MKGVTMGVTCATLWQLFGATCVTCVSRCNLNGMVR